MRLRFAALLVVLALSCIPARPYSLLTHEQLIDLTWQDSIAPLLLSRYPNLTPADLEQARAFAYGGCEVQDLGYYPFGDSFYSNLTHYVRSGDFVASLFRNAKNANELAFAVGALSHYIGDSIGHSEAINLAVPIEFAALRQRYGNEVNYAEGKHQHVQTEFAFDIEQIAHRRVAPLGYARHVGLRVPQRLLSDAFYETYGVHHFAGHNGRFNVGEYRFAIRTFIPRIAYAVTLLRRKHEIAEPTTADTVEIEKQAAIAAAAGNWNAYRRPAGIGTHLLAGVLWVLPKVGPLALANVKGPTEQTESDYMRSLLDSANSLRTTLRRFVVQPSESTSTTYPPGQPVPRTPTNLTQKLAAPRDPHHPLPNRDLDTGRVVQPGGYSLTDATYADLLHRLTQTPQQPIPPGIVEDIQAYYANLDAPITTRRKRARWNEVLADLKTLATMPVNPWPEELKTYGDDEDSEQ
jgi:hypothetical protein